MFEFFLSKWLDGGCVKITSTVIHFSESDIKVNMRFVLAFAIFLALHTTWAEDEEIYDDDMVILEGR